MILARPAIISLIEHDIITVDPFEPNNVGPNSVDIRLGRDMFFLHRLTDARNPYREQSHYTRLNTWSAQELAHIEGLHDLPEDVGPDTDCFFLQPNRFYLGTTYERCGARHIEHPDDCCIELGLHPAAQIAPEMRARSTFGRLGLTVAKCAGTGDIGYNGVWTLEIQTPPCGGPIVLAIGTRIAQMVLHITSELQKEHVYGGPARYLNKGQHRVLPKPIGAPNTKEDQ